MARMEQGSGMTKMHSKTTVFQIGLPIISVHPLLYPDVDRTSTSKHAL